jgi:hypothetical protein
MKAWSAALATEVATWPNVTSRPMFGMTALYRRRKIFAALPRTRCMDLPDSVAFKLESPGPAISAKLRRDSRIAFTDMAKARWLSFEIRSDADLRDALEWLGRAYEAAS